MITAQTYWLPKLTVSETNTPELPFLLSTSSIKEITLAHDVKVHQDQGLTTWYGITTAIGRCTAAQHWFLKQFSSAYILASRQQKLAIVSETDETENKLL